jgi:hypothetical protein
MTPEALEELILATSDPWELQRAFAGLDEKARAKLSPAAQRLYRQLRASKANDDASDHLKALLARRGKDSWGIFNSREDRNATLALFALGPFSAVKKRGIRIWNDEAVFARIMEDRRPAWIDDWIALELEEDLSWLSLPTIRAWVKAGVCRKPSVDGYYRKFAAHLMRTRTPGDKTLPVPPISRQLLDDPDLLEDVAGIFKVETIAFNTNRWLKKGAAPEYETWPEALLKLSDRGRLDRAVLLRLALDGQRLDFKENQLSGLHRFYARMAPTPEEMLRHQPDYIDLLSHPVGHVAKFAIDMLVKVEKQGALDAGPVLREIQGVFAGEGKGNALAALKLIERVAAHGEPGEAPAALMAAAEALRHPNAEVQLKSLDLLEANASGLGRSHLDLITELESFVSASNRGRLRALTDGILAAELPRLNPEPAPVGAPASYETGARPETYSPISGDIIGQSVLFADAELTPINSVDALIDALLHAVEVVDSPDEIELIVDAINRLASQPPADLDQRVAPLLHRLQQGRTGHNGLGASHIGVGLAVIDLIFSWARGQLFQTERQHAQYYSQDDAFAPMIAHLRAVAKRAARREGRLRLSTPTHKGGWIDPVVWVGRLRELAQLADLDHTMDLRLSLLRLAPDRRAEALEQAGSLPTSIRRIAVFALGGDAVPMKGDRDAYAAWISAARCRAPHADWSAAFAPLNLDDAWPDGLRPADYSWRASQKAGKQLQLRWKTPNLHFAVSCRAEAKPEASGGPFSRMLTSMQGRLTTEWSELPTAALCRPVEEKRYFTGDLSTSWVSQWLAYTWPQNPAGAQMKGASKLAERIDQDSSNWTPGFGFLQSLFQKGRPWGEAGHLLLCVGLIGKDADVKGLAVDALTEGVEDRVFDPRAFANVMTRLCEGQWVKLNRLAAALLQVAQASAWHAKVVSEALQTWLPHLDFEARGAFHVLEVLVETQAITQQPLAEPAQSTLRTVQGSGRTAKLAKDLLRAV